MRLADIQANFSNALLDTHNRFEVEFHCGIVSDQFRAADRLQIYKNNVIFSLVEVLTACYPLTREIIGIEAFEQLAKKCVREYPPRNPDTSQYGEDFAYCVAQVESVTVPVPYLLDVMRFEWLCDRLQFQASAMSSPSLLPIQHFDHYKVSQQQTAKFHLSNQVGLFHSKWAVFDIRNAIITGEFSNLSLEQEQFVVVSIQDNQLAFNKVSEEIYLLLQRLKSGEPIAEITAKSLRHVPSLVANGWLTHFSL